MTKPKHIPECFNGRQRSGGLPCICAQLHACEQRMLDDDVLAAAYHGQAGYAAGLDAAREAVQRVGIQPEPVQQYTKSLAALDALRATNP